MDWIDLVQAKDRWRVVVNGVMNLRVTQNGEGGFFWLAEELLASQQEICCMEGVSKGGGENVIVRYLVDITLHYIILQIRKNCEL